MNKMRMGTVDITEGNIEKIGKLFPNCITEKKSENGVIEKGINFDLLKQELSKEIIDSNEAYEFTWVGKKAAILEANRPISKTLRPCKRESLDWDNTENLYIEGDNLEALKLLQESYLGKVQMIYIDPPYNTGNDFIYRDDFSIMSEEYAEEIGQFDEENNRLFKNSDSNGRFHSSWCSMIYPRLQLARNLLSDDGVIFISIDDNEQSNLKEICDEVFGSQNFIATIIRNTNSSKNQSLFVSVSHEYCLVYAKKIEDLKEKHKNNKWSVPKNNVKEYLQKLKQMQDQGLSNEQITEELKVLTKYPRFIDFTNYWYLDEVGLYRKDNIGGVKNGNMKPIQNPLTGNFDPVPPGGYRYSPEKMQELIDNNQIHFHTDGSLPTVKRYLKDYNEQRPKSIMSDDQRPDYALMEQFNTPFDNPKQMSFMTRLISIFSNDSLIMDFFSGSATTAHATMQLNAEDGGNRKFIMVQIPEKTDKNSKAYAAGYENICEIGKERIRMAGTKIKEETHADIDYGFRVLKIDESNMKDVYFSPTEMQQQMLTGLESNIKPDRTDLDLLFGCLLEWGLPLSLPYTTEQIDGCNVHTYNDGDLIACFNEEISETVIKEIAQRKPLRAVFRDSCFKDSPDKINLGEIFKQKSPDTRIKII